MSYSRWTNSTWYTYWASSDSKKRDDQIFEICIDGRFTYNQLKSDIKGCLQIIANNPEAKVKPDQLELDELEIYMKRFIRDVEADQELS